MEYGLMFNLEIFQSPVVIIYEGKEICYPNGTAANQVGYTKPVVVTKIQARNNEIVVFVEENTKRNDTSWAKGDEVSFF